MDVIELLEKFREEMVDEAYNTIEPVRLKGYTKVGEDRTKKKLARLCEEITVCVRDKTLIPILHYTEQMATERYTSGYDLHQVQTAINALEEAVWKRIFANTPSEKLKESLGLVTTVIGAGKDNLARTYVSLATKTKTTSLNLQALFKGSEGE